MTRQSCFSLLTILSIALAGVILSACARDGHGWNPDDYTAKSGDTLYSIAWRYELDPTELAAWNEIKSNERVRAGMRLHTRQPADYETTAYKERAERDLEQESKNYVYTPPIEAEPLAAEGVDATGKQASALKQSASAKWVKVEKGDSLYAISKRSGVSVAKLVQLNQLKKPYTLQPGQTIFLKPLASSTTPSSSRPTAGAKTKTTTTTSQAPGQWPKSVRWSWPSKGKVVKKFDRRRNDAKGIDIRGVAGDAVLASADGKVVYSGNGLISYGNLIIIKHNRTFLSAYAYNRKLLVKEGDQVKAGAKIAEMGNKEKQTPRLHFEIRKNGKPVDPLKYLPW